MNREMLKEAIAEAKTIKETAIANAKAALEEAFTPQLTAMFAEKLNEEEEEDGVKENYDGVDEGDLSLEEILAELEATNEGDSKMEEEGMYENLDEDLMLEDMSDEEIEELVVQVIDDMIASGKLVAGEESEEGEEEEMDMDMDMDDMDMDMDMEDEEEGEEKIEDEDEIEIDEILAEILGEEKEEVEESIEGMSNLIARAMESPSAGAAAGILAAAGITAAAAKAIYDFYQARKKEKGNASEAKEMEETIAELRNELNEVNLLNAKLLYTNKIFKAKNLTESEKVRVLNTFDKAETVKEVKLVFETLAESLKASNAKKNTIKESLGSASKTIAPAAPKQPIIEVNDAFARMRVLAGLK